MQVEQSGDPWFHYDAADLSLHKQDYLGAIKSLQKVNEWAGGDAELHSRIGDDYYHAKDRNAARREYETAVEMEPTHSRSRWSLIRVGVDADDLDLAMLHLRELERMKQVDFEVLESIPDYSKLIASPSYQKWKAELAK